VETERARKPQSIEDAEVLPHLFLYWREHGCNTLNPDTIAGSLRAFMGFLLQDEVGFMVRFSALTRAVFRRFIAWRMSPHSFTVDWLGREMTTVSKGVKGESVQRNLDDVRASLNHAVDRERIPVAPKVPGVPKADRSPPRDLRMSLEALGAMIGFASQAAQIEGQPIDKGFGRWLWLMIGTACRPEAALAFNPVLQWNDGLIDLHPPGAPRTKKHNPVIPAPSRLARLLDTWRTEALKMTDVSPPKSRGRAWRTMRRALELPVECIPKTLRHTIATELRRRGVPGEELSVLLGHKPAELQPMTAVYARYDPNYLIAALRSVDVIIGEVDHHAREWIRTHKRIKVGNAPTAVRRLP
jgi:hypothetical protein